MQTDEGKLIQILRNFMSNAVKFTQRGEIRIAARPGEERTVIFSVSDTGIGIIAEDLPRIFEEFGQIENSLQARSKGTGLGLPLARKLAELLGGAVSVESESGVGSTFSVAIPRIYSPPLETGETAANASPPTPEPTDQPSSPIRALIVDDQEQDRYLLRILLVAMGPFELIEVSRGEEAIERALGEHPHVIVLDLGLPDMSGFQVLDRLKSDDRTRDIPVIVNTSKVLDEQERRLLEGRVIAILDKTLRSREEAAARLRSSLGEAGLDPSRT